MPYDPSEVAARMQHRRGAVRSRTVSLIITIVVMIGLYFFFSGRQGGAVWFVVYGIVLAVSVGWLAWSVSAYRRARQEAASIPAGTAVRISRPGIEIGGQRFGWTEVTGVAVVKGKLGQGQLLRVSASQGRQAAIALRHINIPLATLDTTARAYSAGRHGVDLSALDN